MESPTSQSKDNHEIPKSQGIDDVVAYDGFHKQDQQRGVTNIEGTYRVFRQDRWLFVAFLVALNAVIFAYTLQNGTIFYYQAEATKQFGQQANLLGIISTAASIIRAVSQPFVAKVSDITSRPMAYSLSLLFFIIGYVIMAAAQNGYAFSAGYVLAAFGFEGIILVVAILLSDISPLQWRIVADSNASIWYVVTVWFASNIQGSMNDRGLWRWGIGMFCIIVPIVSIPLLLILFGMEHNAHKKGEVSFADSAYIRRTGDRKQSYISHFLHILNECDAVGLLILMFAWALLLLPPDLYTDAKGGWSNRKWLLWLCLDLIDLILSINDRYGGCWGSSAPFFCYI